MKPSFIPASSFAYMVYQNTGRKVPCFIQLDGDVEAYNVPTYDPIEMFILCPMIAKALRGA